MLMNNEVKEIIVQTLINVLLKIKRLFQQGNS